jgi:hypothetical protein
MLLFEKLESLGYEKKRQLVYSKKHISKSFYQRSKIFKQKRIV